jgi:hypothetical protein
VTEREKQKTAREMARMAARDLWHAKVIYLNQYRDTERTLLPCFLGALDSGSQRKRQPSPSPAQPTAEKE